jgi:hypothetical protein
MACAVRDVLELSVRWPLSPPTLMLRRVRFAYERMLETAELRAAVVLENLTFLNEIRGKSVAPAARYGTMARRQWWLGRASFLVYPAHTE